MFISPINSAGIATQVSGEQIPAKAVVDQTKLAGHSATPHAFNGLAGSSQAIQLESAINAVSKFIQPVAKNLEFSVDAETNKVVVKIIDTETHEVVRQYPSEQLLAIAHTLNKLEGLLFKLKA